MEKKNKGIILKDNGQLKGIFSKLSKYKYPLIIVIVGIALVLFPTGGEKKGKRSESDNTIGVENEFSISELEKRLESILAQCEGVGRVKVLLTQKSSAETIYEYNTVRNNEKKSEGEQNEAQVKEEISIALVQNDSYGQNTVVRKQEYPVLKGALIVCDGGGSDRVKLLIVEAVKALTGITSENISVIKMKT